MTLSSSPLYLLAFLWKNKLLFLTGGNYWTWKGRQYFAWSSRAPLPLACAAFKLQSFCRRQQGLLLQQGWEEMRTPRKMQSFFQYRTVMVCSLASAFASVHWERKMAQKLVFCAEETLQRNKKNTKNVTCEYWKSNFWVSSTQATFI